jgi:putative ABC transport system substrate-binding protein
MRRRDFITLLGSGAAAAWPLLARAQQSAMPVVGVLGSGSAESFAPRLAPFRQGLKETGLIEGQNFAIEFHWANDQLDRLPAMAANLARRQVSLIATMGNNLPALAARAATTRIPIVFMMGADPVQLGLVASLGRPGGNITGVTVLASDQIQKRLQLLHDVVPNARVFGLLQNPGNAGAITSSGRTVLELAADTARSLGITIELANVRTVGDFDAAFASLKEKRIDALATGADALFYDGRERLAALAARYAMPAIFHSTEAAQAGGLIGYSASDKEAYRQGGLYTGRILKGAKPGDLPVLLPTKFEFVINLKTAKALGITISPQLLVAADEVIE